jgi:hypothetical protein
MELVRIDRSELKDTLVRASLTPEKAEAFIVALTFSLDKLDLYDAPLLEDTDGHIEQRNLSTHLEPKGSPCFSVGLVGSSKEIYTPIPAFSRCKTPIRLQTSETPMFWPLLTEKMICLESPELAMDRLRSAKSGRNLVNRFLLGFELPHPVTQRAKSRYEVMVERYRPSKVDFQCVVSSRGRP